MLGGSSLTWNVCWKARFRSDMVWYECLMQKFFAFVTAPFMQKPEQNVVVFFPEGHLFFPKDLFLSRESEHLVINTLNSCAFYMRTWFMAAESNNISPIKRVQDNRTKSPGLFQILQQSFVYFSKKPFDWFQRRRKKTLVKRLSILGFSRIYCYISRNTEKLMVECF